MHRFFGLILAVGAALALVSCNSAVPAPKIDSFTAQPSTVTSGSNVTLSWSVTGGQPIKLSIDNGVGDVTGKTSITVDPTATTTYTLTASDAAGSVTASTKVTVKTVAPTITSFTANPGNITSGGSATLSWSVSGTAPITLSIDNGVGDVTGKTSVTVKPTKTTTYSLTATNAAGSITKQATVTVGSGTGSGVSITSFAANPEPVQTGQPATFTWSLSGASGTVSCTLDPGDGSAPLTISDCANTTSKSHTYTTAGSYTATLSVQGTGASTGTSVTVVAPPSIASFAANPTAITAGSSSTLTWSVSGTSPITLSIDNGVGTVTGQSSVSVSPTATTTYTLTAKNAVGTVTAQATVTVNPATKPSITSFTANPSTITTGGSTTLSWTVSGTTPITLSIDNGVGTVTGQSSVSVSPTTSTTYTLTATNAAGSTTAQTTVTVNATSGTTVTVTESSSVSWLAAQDGSGAWQTLSGTSFTVSSASGKYGVAWACPASSSNPALVGVVQGTVAESTSVTTFCSSSVVASAPYTVSGTVSNIPSGFTASLVLSQSSSAFVGGSTSVASPGGSYSLNADAGTHALLAYDLGSGNSQGTMVLKRGISVSGNVSGVNVDMSAGQPFSMGTVNLVGAASGAGLSTGASFGVSGEGIVGLGQGSSSSVSYPLVPAALQLSGDRYYFSGSAFGSSTQQSVSLVASTPGSVVSLQLPPVVSGSAGVQVSGGTGVVSWGSLSFGTGGATTYLVSVDPTSGSGVGWGALVTQGWLGSSSSYTFPSFTGTSGWDSAWDFPVNQSAYVGVGALHGNVTSTQLLQVIESQSQFGGGSLPDGASVEETARSFTGTY